MIPENEFIAGLKEKGFDFFTGVPCSLLHGLVMGLEEDKSAGYVAAIKEDAAAGLACGASMAGRKSMVLMQNSGLGYSLNAFTSLHMIYKTPCLILMSWRGYEGKDAPEHIIMGQINDKLLDTVGIPWRELTEATWRDDLAWAEETMAKEQVPVTLLVRKGVFRGPH